MVELTFLIIGLLGLIGGTQLVIRGAMFVADYYKLSQMFVGVTILAIGTDLPEMFVAIDGAIEKRTTGVETSGIIIGNAFGSAMSQISLILGFAGLIGTLVFARKHLIADGLMILSSIVLVFILGFDGLITQKEGIIMILVYLIYYVRLFQQEKVIKKVHQKFSLELPVYILFLVIGLIILAYASKLTVENAVLISEQLHINQSLIGILLIGVGTSLPELALSIGAAKKKAYSLSVGNLIGSNIFDLLMPIGIGATITELEFDRSLILVDFPIMMAVTFLALAFFYKRKGLTKTEAIILIGIFLVYAILKIMRLW